MTVKRALVVDDSRSARAFLTRILERYELAVDGVETAEQAIEYLTRERPDVIFMDHLMPGMDGFQAVQAIKNNPRTATIPIMMYTSQEGELYLSQARALGALGVLPKQIRHADVSKALEQLKLLGSAVPEGEIATNRSAALEREEQPPPKSAGADTAPPAPSGESRSADRPALPAIPPELRAVFEAMLNHHAIDLRRFVVENFENNADRIVGDVRLLLQDAAAPLPAPPAPRQSSSVLWGLAALAAVAIIAAAAFGMRWLRESAARDAVAGQLATTEQQLARSREALQGLQQAAAAQVAAVVGVPAGAAAVPGSTDTLQFVDTVPFGETPLAGGRLDHVQALLARLTAQGFRGTVQVRTYPGRFCLGGGEPVGLAAPDTLYSHCDQIGNPRDEGSSSSQRQSVAFANMIAAARKGANGAFEVQVAAGGSDEVAVPYPPVTDTLTAADWNHAAAANNRVEVRWQPQQR